MRDVKVGFTIESSQWREWAADARFAFNMAQTAGDKASAKLKSGSEQLKDSLRAQNNELTSLARSHTENARVLNRSARGWTQLGLVQKGVTTGLQKSLEGLTRRYEAYDIASVRSIETQKTRVSGIKEEVRYTKELIQIHDKEAKKSTATPAQKAASELASQLEGANLVSKQISLRTESESLRKMREAKTLDKAEGQAKSLVIRDDISLSRKDQDFLYAKAAEERTRATIASSDAANVRNITAERKAQAKIMVEDETRKEEAEALRLEARANSPLGRLRGWAGGKDINYGWAGQGMGNAYQNLATGDATNPIGAIAPVVGAIGSIAGTAGGGLAGLISDLNIPLISAAGGFMRRFAEVAGPMAEAVLISGMENAQQVYGKYAGYESSVYQAAPFLGMASNLTMPRGRAGVDGDIFSLMEQQGYDPSSGIQAISQLAQASGTNFGGLESGGVEFLNMLRSGIGEQGITGMMGLGRLGGGGGGEANAFSALTALMRTSQGLGMPPQMASQLASGFGSMLGGIGDSGVDFNLEGLTTNLGEYSAFSGLEGTRGLTAMQGMSNVMGRASQGGMDPMMQSLIWGAAKDIGVTDYLSIMRLLEQRDPDLMEAIRLRMSGLGPMGGLIASRAGVGSIGISENFLAGEMGGAPAGAQYEAQISRGQMVEANVEGAQIAAGAPLADSVETLSRSLITLQASSAAVGIAFTEIVEQFLPALSGMLVGITAESLEFVGAVTAEQADELHKSSAPATR